MVIDEKTIIELDKLLGKINIDDNDIEYEDSTILNEPVGTSTVIKASKENIHKLDEYLKKYSKL